MAVQRTILVDDTSSLIQYEGPWFADATGSQDALGNYGPVFNKTLHGTKESASFTFAYSGTSINVIGTNNLRNDTGTPDPQWECDIDGTLLPNNPFRFAENNWYLCSGSPPQDGSHTLTVKVTVRQNQTFWLDRLIYTPSSTVPLNDKVIVVENNDPELHYGSGWGGWGGGANATSQTGSTFSFSFTGVSISWFGYIANESPHVATTGTFSIDGNTPTSFAINALAPPTNVPTLYNQRLFSTSDFSPGPHKLDVVFLGSGKTTFLILDYLVIQNGTVAAVQTAPVVGDGLTQTTQVTQAIQTTPVTQTIQTILPGGITTSITITSGGGGSSPDPSTVPSTVSGESSSHSVPLGPIIGGVLGGLLVVAVVLLVCYAHRLRRKQGTVFKYERRPRSFIGGHATMSESRPHSSYPNPGISSTTAPRFLPPSKLSRYQQCTPTSPGNSPEPRSTTSSGPVPRHAAQSPSTLSSDIVVHQDSGVRNVLSSAPRMPVEVPPFYTAT